MSKAWKKFGVDIKLNATDAERIIKWGNNSHEDDNIRSEKSIDNK